MTSQIEQTDELPPAEMAERTGVSTEAERRELLLAHRGAVEHQIEARRDALRLIDHKLSFYGKADA